jgi:hypothetical protein
LTIAWLAAGQALGAESAANAIRAFGLIGTWSVDCGRDVVAARDRTTGCGARVAHMVSPPGQPMIRNIVGTLVAGPAANLRNDDRAGRIADHKIAITSVQRTASSVTPNWYP